MNEFEKYSPNLKSETVAPIINNTSLFTTSVPFKAVVENVKSQLNIGEIMETGKILPVNLSKGEIGVEASTLMGSILVTAINLSVM